MNLSDPASEFHTMKLLRKDPEEKKRLGNSIEKSASFFPELNKYRTWERKCRSSLFSSPNPIEDLRMTLQTRKEDWIPT